MLKSTDYRDSSSSIAVVARADWIDICRVRAGIYAVLSRGYLNEVTPELLADLKIILPILLQMGQITDNQPFVYGVSGLKILLDDVGNQDDFLENLSRAYTTLFLVGRKEVTVNPYESVYVSDERLIMQEQRDQVMEFYDRFGMGVIDTFNAPEDHVSAELSFMSSMSLKMAEDLDNGNTNVALRLLEAQLDFIKEHMLRWFPAMSNDIRRVCSEGFYFHLANVTHDFVRNDFAFLQQFIHFMKDEDCCESISIDTY